MVNYDEMLVKGDVDGILARVREVCATKVFLKRSDVHVMEPDDIVQEVLIQVYKKIKEYNSEKARFSTYIETLINNKLNDCYRKPNTQSNKLLKEAISPRKDYRYDVDEYINYPCEGGYGCIELVMTLKDRLNSNEIQLLSLLVNGLKQKEIAVKMNYTPPRINQLVQKLRKKVGKMI